MATGSGKTVVMGMLIAWQALNQLASPQDARFSDSFHMVVALRPYCIPGAGACKTKEDFT
jgi:hypothetical protein